MIKSVEIVDFQKFEEVHAQQFETHAQVLSENDVVLDVDDVHDIVHIVLLQVLQNLEFHAGLVVVLLFVLHDLDCNLLLLLVVDAPEGCAETSLTQELDDLVSVADVVVHDHLVVS